MAGPGSLLPTKYHQILNNQIMHLQNYLRRLGFEEQPEATAETLIALHRAHVLQVPFENLHIMAGLPIKLDSESLYQKIVEQGRGGFCYELNGLFREALEAIGFECFFISCNVHVPHIDGFAADFGHVALMVRAEADWYLTDVGFGDAFIEPLKLVFGEDQLQHGIRYRLSRLEQGEVLLEKSADGEHYQKMFKFALKAHPLYAFEAMCLFHQTAAIAPFNKQQLCTRPTPDGRVTLTSKSLTITTMGQKQEIVINGEADFEACLARYFNIYLQPVLQ